MFWRSIAAALIAVTIAGAAAPTHAADKAANPLARAEARQRAAEAMLANITQATWIRDGKSTHVIYVFFDPNCPYCHQVYETLRPHVERGEVELRWIVVGKLMATSLGKAATLLEAKDPTEAFHRNERGFSRESGAFGGVEEEPLPRDDTLRRLNANLELLKRSGNDAVPLLLFRTRDGKADLVLGAPPAAFFAKLLKDIE